jgi:hypothetical protein
VLNQALRYEADVQMHVFWSWALVEGEWSASRPGNTACGENADRAFQFNADGHTSLGLTPLAARDAGQDIDLGASLFKADSFDTQ